MRKRDLAKRLLPLLGIALFLFIISKLDINGIIGVAKNIRWWLLVLGVVTAYLAVYLKAWKWKKIIDYSGMKYTLSNSFIAWLVGFAVGMITPGRVGDFYRSVYLKTSNKKPLGVCFATVFLDRIVDIIIMLIFAGLGVIYLILGYNVPYGRELAITVVVLALLSLVFLFVFRENVVRKLVRPLFYRFIPERYHKDMKKNYKSFFSLFNRVMEKPSMIAVVFIIGLLGWLIAFFEMYLLALALNLDVSYVFIGSIAPIINMIELIPISFSGIGTRDAAMIFFMGLVSVNKEAAVAFSLLILVVIYVIAIPGIIYWMKHPTELPK